MNEQINRIEEKLAKVRELDEDLQLFGAAKHQYKLNPVIPIEKIRQFEAAHQVTLPAGYITFLTTVGNGGAGPYYGLERLEHGLYSDLDSRRPDSRLNPAKPFLFTGAWNRHFRASASYNGDQKEFEESETRRLAFEEEYFDRQLMDGVIAICNFGCGVSLNLVVNGAEYGVIWADDRGSDGGIYPSFELGNEYKLTFLDWYEYWLDKSLEKLSLTPAIPKSFHLPVLLHQNFMFIDLKVNYPFIFFFCNNRRTK